MGRLKRRGDGGKMLWRINLRVSEGEKEGARPGCLSEMRFWWQWRRSSVSATVILQ